jgi:hypothetical protein
MQAVSITMAAKVSRSCGNAPESTVLKTTTPHAALVSFGPRPHNLADQETPRQKKRREWQDDKIKKSREKNKKKPGADSAEQSGPGISDSAGSETPDAPQSSQTIGIEHKGRYPRPDRSPSEWKEIRELKLCASCLMKTVPAHKPGDEGAPCAGQSDVPFDKAKIARIRKELRKELLGLDKASRGVRTGPLHQSRSRQPGNDAWNNYQMIASQGSPQYRPYNGTGSSHHLVMTLNTSSGAPATPVGLFVRPEPIPTTLGRSPYPERPSRLDRSTRYSRQTVARSESSATHVDGSDGLPHVEQSSDACSSTVHTPVTPIKHSKDLAVNLFGMDWPTPSTTGVPEIRVEDFGPICEEPRHSAAIPVPESSGLVPRDGNNSREWDGETKVSVTADEFKPAEATGDASSKALALEKLRSDEESKFSPVRSWTLQGLGLTPVSHGVLSNRFSNLTWLRLRLQLVMPWKAPRYMRSPSRKHSFKC